MRHGYIQIHPHIFFHKAYGRSRCLSGGMPTSSGQRLSNRRLEVPVDEVSGVEVGKLDEDVQTKNSLREELWS